MAVDINFEWEDSLLSALVSVFSANTDFTDVKVMRADDYSVNNDPDANPEQETIAFQVLPFSENEHKTQQMTTAAALIFTYPFPDSDPTRDRLRELTAHFRKQFYLVPDTGGELTFREELNELIPDDMFIDGINITDSSDESDEGMNAFMISFEVKISVNEAITALRD